MCHAGPADKPGAGNNSVSPGERRPPPGLIFRFPLAENGGYQAPIVGQREMVFGMDTVAAMIVFAKVVEANSFSEAARRLGQSKSAISKQVAGLEDRLGARLLNRTTRRLSLTEVGAALYERCARIATEVEAAEQIVTHLHAAPRGTLRVNAPMSFGHLHLAPTIPAFLDRYPEVTIDLTLNDRFVDLIDEGYDLAIRIARLTDSSLVARKLAPARLVLCAAPSYVARRGAPLAPNDLQGHECIIYAQQTLLDQWQFLDGEGHRSTVGVRGRLQSNNGDAIRAALLAGAGIGRLPTFLVGPDICDGRLVRLLPDYDSVFDGGVYAIYPHSRHLSPKVRAFVDFLVESYGPQPTWDRL